MQKYIKVTGGAAVVQVVNCKDIIGIVRPDSVGRFGISTTPSQTKIVYMDSESASTEVTIFAHSGVTGADAVAQANFIKNLIVQAWEQPYTEPFVSVAVDEFPAAVTSVNPAAS